MVVGPIFTREMVVTPRHLRHYASRATYVAALMVLMCTAWQVLAGTQAVRNLGDLARFGMALFQILASLQLVLATLFSSLFAASVVSQEKDRRTLVLLLLTNLSNFEIVLGKLGAGLLNVFVMLVAAVPLFFLVVLLGGVSFEQVVRAFWVTLASTVAAGSLGAMLAFWRERTFQAVALTLLLLVLWLTIWELVGYGTFGSQWLGIPVKTWAVVFSPWQAIMAATRPVIFSQTGCYWPVYFFLMAACGMVALFNGVTVIMVRYWNPSRTQDRSRRPFSTESKQFRSVTPEEVGELREVSSCPQIQPELGPSLGSSSRRVWDNPILWREIRTWAYGHKVLVVRVIYLSLFSIAAALLFSAVHDGRAVAGGPASMGLIPAVAKPIIPLFVLSLVLVNALAVTSFTTERDSKAIDLLLVTDLTPKEIIFGKLGGIFYNTKEMILLPMGLCIYLWYKQQISLENLFYIFGGLLVMTVFVAMLGLHVAMMYTNSRTAIGTSLGTVVFLFIGVATCMRMILAFSGSFSVQLQPFFVFMLGGGIGLYVALGSRNPSPAISLASFLAPFATFYVITSFLLGYPFAVFSVTTITYGFATAAMLIPALYEFDVVTGRTTPDHE